MKYYLWIIKTRWQSNPLLFGYWLLLRIKKFFKIDFLTECSDQEIQIDIVIPTVSKDYALLQEVVTSIRQNICQSINKVYIVSRNDKDIIDFCSANNCQFIDELTILGYGKNAISYTVQGIDRSGWMFQQLLKLGADTFTESENYFVLDSDTILINKHSLLENGKFVFFQNEEWHKPYFRSFKKIFGYSAPTKLSYTSHMMIFNHEKLTVMKQEMEQKHRISWDQVYLSTIDPNEASCISDYDTYANWLLYNYPELVINRPLYNKPLPRSEFKPLGQLQEEYSSKLKSLSFHSYINLKS
jgi:hypothetical protein